LFKLFHDHFANVDSKFSGLVIDTASISQLAVKISFFLASNRVK